MRTILYLALLLPSVAFATNYNETRTDLQIVEDHGTSTGWFGCSRHPSSSGCAQSRVIIDHEGRITANTAKSAANMMSINSNSRSIASQGRLLRHTHNLAHQNEDGVARNSRNNYRQDRELSHNRRVDTYQQYRIERNTRGIYYNRHGIRDNAAAISELRNDTVKNANDIANLQDELGDTQSSVANVAAMIGSISNIHFDKNSTSLQGALGFGVSNDTKDGQSISFGIGQQTSEGTLWTLTYTVAGSTQVLGAGANWDF